MNRSEYMSTVLSEGCFCERSYIQDLIYLCLYTAVKAFA